jgi:hypothetical protein
VALVSKAFTCPCILTFCHLDKAKKEAKKLLYDNPEVQLFGFQSIELATNNFSGSNKLGQGGFGQVYRVSVTGLLN